MARKTKKTKGTILIIDDEKAILATLRTMFESEGYSVYTADGGEKGLVCIESLEPEIILLDIWLPEIDGLELLMKIKERRPGVPVIMISGHAGIETAVRATKLGAADFLEKPFTMERVLRMVGKHIRSSAAQAEMPLPAASEKKRQIIHAKGDLVWQATISKSVVLNGFGLMNGRKIGMQLLPSPPGSGIRFIDIASNSEIPLSPANLLKSNGEGANSTALSVGKARARTVEHLLATLHAYGISNLTIKIDEEIPNVDGSAIDFCRIIREAGIEQQKERIAALTVKKRHVFGTVSPKTPYMIFTPSSSFSLTLRIDFPKPVGVEKLTFIMKSGKAFEKDIAPARSFNTIENIDMAQKSGAVGGGMIASHIILSGGKVINTKLRYPDEFVRHKMLDVIGDLFLAGRPVRAKIVANRTSHAFNHLVIAELARLYGG
ncbi:MAG: UDP-3-O-acyl-N-acetylglucosamine deacetylase [Spirochaetota bacterium]